MYNELIKIRKKKKVSKKVLAQLLSLTTSDYNSKEKSINDFTLDEALTLSKFLNMKFEDIFLKEM